MRRQLIQGVLPVIFCAVPALAAALIAASLPRAAREFYVDNLSALDRIILGLGTSLFALQLWLSWRALQWRGNNFNTAPESWLANLAQAAEWFPLLGLIGTVAGIMQTFSGIRGPTPPERIISLYAPAMTATGSGLFMSLVNILPTWIVLVGRQLIVALGGGGGPPADEDTAGDDTFVPALPSGNQGGDTFTPARPGTPLRH